MRLTFPITLLFLVALSCLILNIKEPISLAIYAQEPDSKYSKTTLPDFLPRKKDKKKANILQKAGNSESHIRRARGLALHNRRYWRLLLHYPVKPKVKVQEGGRSQVLQSSASNYSTFFLSPEGAKDPQKELEATLLAFFDDSSKHEKNKHAQCVFPARLAWLKKNLPGLKGQLPQIDCPHLKFWVKTANAKSASLIFADAYLNAPASTFGHTLIRIDSQKYGKNPLLSYSINFGAAIPEKTNIAAYLLKGLFGGFPGVFTFIPYHVKVQEYNNIEQRDLWEYPLKLNKQELERLVLHTWEMDSARFSYYFTSKNCSYQLLTLLELARPELDLRSHFPWITLPIETIKVSNAQGILKKPVFRPSSSTQNQARIKSLPKAQKQLVFRTLRRAAQPGTLTKVQNALQNYTVQERTRIVDILLKILLAEKNKDKLKEKQSIFYKALLEYRLALPQRKSKLDPKLQGYQPHKSHAPDRFDITGGYSSFAQSSFVGIGYRPLLHAYIDNDEGYPAHSELLALQLQLRYWENTQRLTLDELTLLRILSLAPYEPYQKSISYRLRIQIDTQWYQTKELQGIEQRDENLEERHERTRFLVDWLAGLAFTPFQDKRQVLGILSGVSYSYVNALDSLSHLLEPELLLIYGNKLGKGWKTQAKASYFFPSILGSASKQSRTQLELTLRYAISKKIQWTTKYVYEKEASELSTSLSFFL